MPDLSFQLGLVAGLILVLGALVIGIAYQFMGEPTSDFEWVVGAVAALVGGFAASEYLGTVSTQGPEFDGLYMLPALVGGIVVSGVLVGVIRLARGAGSHMAA